MQFKNKNELHGKRTEKDIQSAILNYLSVMGITAWRQNTGAVNNGKRLIRFGIAGMSDIIGLLPSGEFLAIEVKSDKGKLTERQKEFIDAIKRSNGVVIVARSVEDVNDVVGKYFPGKLLH